MAIPAPSIAIFPAKETYDHECVDSAGIPLVESHPTLPGAAANDNRLRPAQNVVRKRIFMPGWPTLEVEEELRIEERHRPRFAPGWP